MIPQSAIDLILNFEGIDQPSLWPGEDSGITIGRGYDLGYEQNFEKDWSGVLPQDQITILKTAIGLKGQLAANRAHGFTSITISKAQADHVFIQTTLPHYENETLLAFPGLVGLPAIVIGALVSLVFNRGSGMDGGRRSEMRDIRTAIAAQAQGSLSMAACLRVIAVKLRSMERLWRGTGLGGLIRRREAEAQLVESAIPSLVAIQPS